MDRTFTGQLLLLILPFAALLSGCFPPKDAIRVSNDVLDFSRNERPLIMDVWNTNASIDNLTIRVRPRQSWILTNVTEVTSAAPGTGGQAYDKKSVVVSIDRRQLAAGTYEGNIDFTASRVVTVPVIVRVIQDQDGSAGGLYIENAAHTYSEPYLIDFSFCLQDGAGESVVAEPAQFDVLTAREGSSEVNLLETGLHLRRGAARQLKVMLVLDYTFSMQSIPGAIAAMEEAATDVFLPALNSDALVGVIEFHRDDQEAAQAAGFSVDKDYVAERIAAIQDEFVHGFYSASRAWDAVVTAADRFSPADRSEEERFIILLSDGDDTSSVNGINEAVDAAEDRGIHIYVIGFNVPGQALPSLLDITSRTDGEFFAADSVDDFEDTFRGIVDNLGGQYNLRWGSLRRDNTGFKPSFTIGINGTTAAYQASRSFVPHDYAGNVLEGVLRLVPSDNEDYTTVFLRAEYVPRFIRRLRIFIRSSFNFTVTGADAAEDGLLDGWAMTSEAASGGRWFNLSSPGAAMPFATFGPLLRIDFDELAGDDVPLFEEVYADNSIYENGQSFIVEGFE